MDFTSLYNHHEREVFAAVMDNAPQFPDIERQPELLADVACVALNRLPPRYIRHAVDYSLPDRAGTPRRRRRDQGSRQLRLQLRPGAQRAEDQAALSA